MKHRYEGCFEFDLQQKWARVNSMPGSFLILLLNKMRYLLLTFEMLFLAGVLLSCTAKVSFTQTGKLYPPHNGPVKIYENPPKGQDYEEIGWVSSEGDWNNAWGDLLGQLQKLAASKGANAIILVASNYPETWGYRRRSGERSIIAKAVRVEDQ